MSVQATVPRPAGKSVGSAALGFVATLTIFVVTFLAFLIAPLVLFGAALVAYLVLRPRTGRRLRGDRPPPPAPSSTPGDGSHDFGAGAP